MIKHLNNNCSNGNCNNGNCSNGNCRPCDVNNSKLFTDDREILFIRVDSATKNKLRQEAASRNMTLNKYVNLLLENKGY